MKVLFTSVGRRVELVQSFKNAAKELSIDLDVIGADMSKSAPALFFCDEKKIVPSITNPNYIEQLIDICKKESVDCLIPTIDTELIILAKYKNIFSSLGTIVLISDLDKIKICRDKKRTADYFCSLGLKSPKAVDDIEELQEIKKFRKK